MAKKIKSLLSHQGFMRYFKNTSWLFVEKALRMIVGLSVGVWVARYLGPERFGILNYAQSFVGLFTAVATLGLDGIVVRELVKDKSRRDELIGTALWLKFAGALSALAILGVAVNFTSNNAHINLMVFIIASATIFQSFNAIDFYFQSVVLSKYVVYANMISLFLSSAVKVILILNAAPLVAFAWVVLFDSFVLAFGLVYFYMRTRQKFEIKNFKFNRITAVNLLKDSWPLVLSGMLLMVQARIDQVMLQQMAGGKEVGYYSVALRLIEAFGFIPMLLASSIFPALVTAKKTSAALYRDRFLNYYRVSFLLFIVTFVPIFLFSDRIIVMLYGVAYQPAGILLSLMAIRLFFTNSGVARGAFINIENLFRFSLITMAIGAVINIVLNYYLIPFYQGKGAVIATITSFFATTFLIDFLYAKTRENVILQLFGMLTFYKISISGLNEK